LENPNYVRAITADDELTFAANGAALSLNGGRNGDEAGENGSGPTRPPLSQKQHRVTDNLYQLLDVLPPRLREALEREVPLDDLLEIVLDLGKPSEVRFGSRVVELFPSEPENRDVIAGILRDPMEEAADEGRAAAEITDDDIAYVISRIGDFGLDNRAGI